MIFDQDLVQGLEELKTWLSHKIPKGTYQDLIREAQKIANRKLKKRRLGSEKRGKVETKTFGGKAKGAVD